MSPPPETISQLIARHSTGSACRLAIQRVCGRAAPVLAIAAYYVATCVGEAAVPGPPPSDVPTSSSPAPSAAMAQAVLPQASQLLSDATEWHTDGVPEDLFQDCRSQCSDENSSAIHEHVTQLTIDEIDHGGSAPFEAVVPQSIGAGAPVPLTASPSPLRASAPAYLPVGSGAASGDGLVLLATSPTIADEPSSACWFTRRAAVAAVAPCAPAATALAADAPVFVPRTAFEYQPAAPRPIDIPAVPFALRLTAEQQHHMDWLRGTIDQYVAAMSVSPGVTPYTPSDYSHHRRPPRLAPTPGVPLRSDRPPTYTSHPDHLLPFRDAVASCAGGSPRRGPPSCSASPAAPRKLRLLDALGLSLVAIPLFLWPTLEQELDDGLALSCGLTVLRPTEDPLHFPTGAAQIRRLRKKLLEERRAGTPPAAIIEDEQCLASCCSAEIRTNAPRTWLLDLVNGTDWGPSLAFLGTTAADVVALQECKRATPVEVAEAEDAARKLKWSLRVSPAIATPSGGRSAGVAVGAKSYYGLGRSPITPTDKAAASRLTSGWFPGIARGGVHVISLYLWAGLDLTHPKNRALLECCCRYVLALDGLWIIAADWQNSPDDLRASKWPEMMHGVIHASSLPTCGNNIIDFFLVCAALSPYVLFTQLLNDAGVKPHRGSRIAISGAPRQRLVRHLRTPKDIVALPRGPLPHSSFAAVQPSHCSYDAVSTSYGDWIGAVEEQVVSLYAVGRAGTARLSGRALPPVEVWRNPCGPPGSDGLKQSFAARRWRLLSCWLTTLITQVLKQQQSGAEHPSPLWINHAVLLLRARRWRLLEDRELVRHPETLVLVYHIPQVPTFLADITHAHLRCVDALRALLRNANAFAAALKHADLKASSALWHQWLLNGAATGGRGIHRWSRGPMGWLPSPSKRLIVDSEDTLLGDAPQHQSNLPTGVPASPQQEAGDEAQAWALQWGNGLDIPPPTFPMLSVPPPPMLLSELYEAIRSFPPTTLLGVDAYNPRMLLRLPRQFLKQLLMLFTTCELLGQWPQQINTVLIPLLPKSDGGRRPIGNFPTFIRTWFRARASHVKRWEFGHPRSFFYAGAGMGADVASWTQAALLEHASASKLASAAAFLDLVKCFERVPYDQLIAEGLHWEYPMWVLRLAIAAYRLGRRISINGVVSGMIYALRGLTAGSVFATTELRLLLLRALDAVVRSFPLVPLQVYIDDVFQHFAGPLRLVIRDLPAAFRLLATGLEALGLEVSRDKTFGLASTRALCDSLQHELRDRAVPFATSDKSLGVDLSADRRRSTRVQRKRLAALKKKRSRVARLRASGVRVAHYFRTGLSSAVAWGVHVIGMATTSLLSWRREVSRGCSATAAGKSVDMALIMADVQESQRTDPAFDVHLLPILHWCTAVWSQRLPWSRLSYLFTRAKARLAKAKSVWSSVGNAPTLAFLATLDRLNWTAPTFDSLRDDLGQTYLLSRDSPAAIAGAVVASVRRWQMRRVALLFPTAGIEGGFFVAPLRKILRTSNLAAAWTSAAQSQLLSALVGGQWTQVRLFKAGLVESPLCRLCGAANGTLAHRYYWCPHPALCDARSKWLPQRLLDRARADCAAGLTLRWERAIWPEPCMQRAVPPAETFEWIIRPPGDCAAGHWFSDGSRLGLQAPGFGSYAWSAGCFNDSGAPIAIARGRSPVWAQSVPGSETWALTQSAVLSLDGSFTVDCLPCVLNWRRGKAFATGAKSKFARAWRLFFAAVDNAVRRTVKWMPSHTSQQDVDDGFVTAFDRACNDVVDFHAKEVARAHTASAADELSYETAAADVVTIAQWIGRAGVIVSETGQQDAELSATAKLTRQRAKLDLPAVPPPPKPPVAALRALELGGHCLRSDPQGWRCTVCRKASASWNRIAPLRCSGSAASKWADLAKVDLATGTLHHRSHNLWLSDMTVWCSTCGQFASEATKGLKAECHHRALGTRTIWTRLMEGRHPRSGVPFETPAVPQFRWQLTSGEPLPAPIALVDAVRKPRGSAAAAKRRHNVATSSAAPPTLGEAQQSLNQRLVAAWGSQSAQPVVPSSRASAAARLLASASAPSGELSGPDATPRAGLTSGAVALVVDPFSCDAPSLSREELRAQLLAATAASSRRSSVPTEAPPRRQHRPTSAPLEPPQFQRRQNCSIPLATPMSHEAAASVSLRRRQSPAPTESLQLQRPSVSRQPAAPPEVSSLPHRQSPATSASLEASSSTSALPEELSLLRRRQEFDTSMLAEDQRGLNPCISFSASCLSGKGGGLQGLATSAAPDDSPLLLRRQSLRTSAQLDSSQLQHHQSLSTSAPPESPDHAAPFSSSRSASLPAGTLAPPGSSSVPPSSAHLPG